MSAGQEFLISYDVSSPSGQSKDTHITDRPVKILNDLSEDSRERNGRFDIELRTMLIRRVIEELYKASHEKNDSSVLEILRGLQGLLNPYKCPKPWCNYFAVGFSNYKDRRNHVERHELPFRCSSKSCFGNSIGFDAQSKLEQHNRNYHTEAVDEFHFPATPSKVANIWSAAAHGDLSTLSAMLDCGQNVNMPCPKGSGTLLYCAAKPGHFETCKLLLERGAKVNGVAPNNGWTGHTALHAATIAGHVDVVNLLLSRDECLPDKEDCFGRTPFCYACALGHLEIVKLLLGTRKVEFHRVPTVHPESCTSSDRTMTPIAYACIEGHFSVAQHLLQEGQCYLLDQEVLGRAVQSGSAPVVNFLLSVGSVKVTTCSPVLKALRKGRTSIARSILSYMYNAKMVVHSDDNALRISVQLAKERGWDELLDAIQKVRQTVIILEVSTTDI